jgi:hypothetical protein
MVDYYAYDHIVMKKHKLQDAMTKIFRQDWTEAHEAFYKKCVDSADV